MPGTARGRETNYMLYTSAFKRTETLQVTMPSHGAPQAAANDDGTPSFLADKSAKVFLAGHKGMLGSAVHRRLTSLGFTDIVGRTRAELDLTCEAAVRKFFDAERPRYVILAAGKVGGLHASAAAPVDFMTENLRITTNVLTAARLCGSVRKLLFLATSAVYPVDAPQPIPESALLAGPPAPGNEWYVRQRLSCQCAPTPCKKKGNKLTKHLTGMPSPRSWA